MAETYCGKSCAQCEHKEPMKCPGCKVGPGRQFSGDCELAKCARTKGHETCETCSLRGNCGNYRNRQFFPEYRRRKQAAEQAKQAALARRIPILAKWLWLLFWLVIPTSISGLLSNDTVGQVFPAVHTFGQILNTLCIAAYGLILLKLGAEEDGYRTAGICTLVSSGLSLVLSILPATTDYLGWTLLFTVPTVIVELIAECCEYSAHSGILAELDQELSQKWMALWKWFLGTYLGLFGSLFVMVLLPVLGVLVMLAAAIGLLVVSILKMVYLYRTAKLFREFSVFQEEPV